MATMAEKENENKDKTFQKTEPFSDEMLFEVPTGLPAWASDLESPLEMPFQDSAAVSSSDTSSPHLENDLQSLKLLSKVHPPEVDEIEDSKEQSAETDVYQQETGQVDIEIHQQEADQIEYSSENAGNSSIDLPVEEPDFSEQASVSYLTTDVSVEATVDSNDNITNDSIDNAAIDNKADVDAAADLIDSAVVDSVEDVVTDPIINSVAEEQEDQSFELPVGEPNFLQDVLVSQPNTIEETDSTVEQVTEQSNTIHRHTRGLQNIVILEQTLGSQDQIETAIDSPLLEDIETKQEISKNNRPLEIDIVKIDPLSEDYESGNIQRIGALESAIATIDSRISYLDFDVNLQSLPSEVNAEDKKERYLSFFLGATNYAIEGHHVTEINKVPQITFVPNVPEWVSGVTNLRGDILSVIDMRSFLGLKATEITDKNRLIVIRNNNSSITTGAIVDEVKGLIEIPVSKIANLPDFYLEEKLKPFFKGVYKNQESLLVLLDIEIFLSSPEIKQFELV